MGVGSGSAGGGVLSVLDADDSEAVGDAGGEASEEPAAGSTTFSGDRVDASVSLTLVAAARPRITPKPRNTSTRSAEMRGEGSLRPDGVRVDAGAVWIGAVGLCTAPARACAWPPTRRRMPSSRALRTPTRAPQLRQ